MVGATGSTVFGRRAGRVRGGRCGAEQPATGGALVYTRPMLHKKRSRSLFRAHGQFSTRVDGRLIISDVTGPWNKELVEEWALASQPVALGVGRHVGIAVIHGSMLCTPEALQVLRRSAAYAARVLDCVAHVIVADKTVEGRDFVEPSFFKAYQDVLPLAMFYTLAEARAWSEALLDALPGSGTKA